MRACRGDCKLMEPVGPPSGMTLWLVPFLFGFANNTLPQSETPKASPNAPTSNVASASIASPTATAVAMLTKGGPDPAHA